MPWNKIHINKSQQKIGPYISFLLQAIKSTRLWLNINYEKHETKNFHVQKANYFAIRSNKNVLISHYWHSNFLTSRALEQLKVHWVVGFKQKPWLKTHKSPELKKLPAQRSNPWKNFLIFSTNTFSWKDNGKSTN